MRPGPHKASKSSGKRADDIIVNEIINILIN